MKRRRLLTSLVFSVTLFLIFGGGALLSDWAASFAESENEQVSDPDRPAKFHGEIDEDEYLRLRDEYVSMRRGMEPGRFVNPRARLRAIEQMERQEYRRKETNSFVKMLGASFAVASAGSTWVAIGPAPLPNSSGVVPGFSGRVTAVAVDPTNPNIVYLGAAQGGVWRSLNGGGTWTSIFDSAQSQAIGALALAPSDHTILYVGTGEFNNCGDCFFGAGLYRIENADTSATLVGPINPSQTISNLTYPIFNGRSISKIVVHPTDANTIFVATGAGVGGSGGNSLGLIPPMATRGVYRSTNATAAADAVTFQKLIVNADNSFDSPQTGNVSISDMVMDPGDPNNLLVGVIGQIQSGGVYRSINALSGTPTFTQALSLAAGIRVSLTINNVGGVATAYAGTSETPNVSATCTTANSGAVRKSTDGGATWSGQLPGGQGYCSGQCLYDMPIAVDPGNANLVYIGGQTSGSCGRLVGKSTDGGASFATDSSGLHADEHALVFDTTGIIYAANDGGLWKRSATAAAGSAWTNLNTAPLNTLQFESVAVHPLDQFLTIGGTQDNGTEAQQSSSGNWKNAEGGDGGYTLIDQSATNTTNVTMYLTFFNRSNTQIMFDRATLTSCLNVINSWPTRGTFACGNPLAPCPDSNAPASQCDNLPFFKNNGMQLTDNVLFYAPMALGPGTPNTVYFGTDRLYRSTDMGDNMTIVGGSSASPLIPTGTRCPLAQTCPPSAPASVGTPISSIGISPQDDNYRVVGMQTGQVFATSTGSSNLVNITSGSFPANPNGSTNRFVGRVIIDPNNKNVAYITFSFYAPAGQGVWKITNLGAAAGSSPVAPIWSAAGNGIPSIPINAFAVDPSNSNNLFAGTDIGVYNSTDGGANWAPYGTGLPRVAVFDMKIQNPSRLLRIATHGRGMWETSLDLGPSTVRLGAADFPVNENNGNGFVTVSFVREGDASLPASVNFASSDTSSLNSSCSQANTGKASERCDYSTSVGTVSWAAGDAATKTINIPIINDALVEGNETFTVSLTSPAGATLGTIPAATVTIIDDDSTPSSSNPIDGVDFFITQQYIDFLGRMPDSVGFANWKNTLGNCPNGGFGENDNPTCDRIHVASGFFQSEEFLNRGYFAFRFYMVSFAQRPTYAQFMPDMAQVGGPKSPAEEEASKVVFANAFVQRPEFLSKYPGLSGQALANALLQTAGLPAGSYNAGTQTNGQILRGIAETSAAFNKFLTEGTVSIQYFGFLRRDPDTIGYQNNVATLQANPNNLRHMVFIFIYSTEYRGRFGTP